MASETTIAVLKLVVLASGPDELRDTVQPIFDMIGQRTMWAAVRSTCLICCR